MTNLRLSDNVFRLLRASSEGFLRRGFAMAVLNTGGKAPETRDGLIVCVTVGGRSSSEHSTYKEVGMGSSEQVFGADTFRTCSSETG